MFVLLPNLQQPRFDVMRQRISAMSSPTKNLSMNLASSAYVLSGSYAVVLDVCEGIKLRAHNCPCSRYLYRYVTITDASKNMVKKWWQNMPIILQRYIQPPATKSRALMAMKMRVKPASR